ncbi:RNase H family protein [Draconibacterium sp. IB214405]|uniref:ribonuclease HI n=1 Tax=Draconibacterium sp. IB214405 TaxID=3097352 RepID=UPI002A11BAFB|nr:RNase H family protein [Draconibacterium sp. IB214405]MDX8340262.1 RNase H family protein [Draconibacterium sp. IB214405]
MEKLYLFTDGSVNMQSKIGFGSCLVLNENELDADNLKQRVQSKRFENTSSTRLELQTLLWALAGLQPDGQQIVIYTDSQNIMQLLERRRRLEDKNFCSKSGKPLKNADLYKQFYKVFDSLICEIVKVQGHQPTRLKNEIERIFTVVDRASRKALRNDISC